MHTHPDVRSSPPPPPDGPAQADGEAGPAELVLPAVEPEHSAPETGARTAELARIDQALAALVRHAEQDAERAAARERVIDRQHAEIERLRSTERAGVLRPVVTDLCRLRNDLLRQAATVSGDLSRTQVAMLLGSFADVVADALERCGVAVLPAPPGAPYVAGQQQVAGHIEVDDPALDNTVDVVVQDGYVEIDGGKVVLPARVTLRRAIPAAQPPPPAGETGEQEDIDINERSGGGQ